MFKNGFKKGNFIRYENAIVLEDFNINIKSML